MNMETIQAKDLEVGKCYMRVGGHHMYKVKSIQRARTARSRYLINFEIGISSPFDNACGIYFEGSEEHIEVTEDDILKAIKVRKMAECTARALMDSVMRRKEQEPCT